MARSSAACSSALGGVDIGCPTLLPEQRKSSGLLIFWHALRALPAPPLTCPDANTMARWFDDEMSAATRLEARAHLDECEACRLLLVEISRDVVPATAHPAVATGDGADLPVLLGSAIDRYHVLEWLGQGGMGVVYAAYDPELERRVALKLLRHAAAADDAGDAGADADADDASVADAAARLLTEAKALARISHPHVVTVHDAGTHMGRVFLVMEHLGGGTLADWCQRTEATAESIVARYAEAAEGLAAAHQAGFVHGDVKPSNLMLGTDGRVRVTDFGLARETSARPGARPGSARGTPAYLAPEQRRGEDADARSDQYSFCVALREALQGAAAAPHVARALDRGLSPDPKHRFADMRAVIAALGPRPRRRSSRLVTALSLGALFALVTATVATVQARADKQRRELCAGAAAQWDGIWTPAEQERAAAAFLGSGAPFAEGTWRVAERETSDYVARWSREYTETCQATRIRREQSEQRMNERLACLEDARDAVRVVAGMFTAAPPAVVEDPARELSTLPTLEACDHPPPLAADLAVRAAELDVKRSLDHAAADDAAGKYAEAAAREEALIEPAARTGNARLEADVAYALGVSLANVNEGARSVDQLYRAVAFAEEARDDAIKARALTYLGFALSAKQSLPEEAAHVTALAAAVVKRVPGDIASRARVEQLTSFLADGQGHFAEGTAASERAVDLLEAAYGPDDFRLSVPLENVGRALEYEGKLPEARAKVLRAADILARTVGTAHPLYARAEYALALLDIAANDPAAARDDARRSLAVYQVTRTDSVERASIELVLDQLLYDQGKYAEALEHGELAVRLTASLPARDDVRASALEQVGEALVKLRRYDEAITFDQQVVDGCARTECDINVKANGALALGEAFEAAGRLAEAVEPLSRAVALRATADAWPAKAASAQFALGRVLWTSKRDERRARELLAQASATFRAHAESHEDAARVDTWLAAHAGARRQ